MFSPVIVLNPIQHQASTRQRNQPWVRLQHRIYALRKAPSRNPYARTTTSRNATASHRPAMLSFSARPSSSGHKSYDLLYSLTTSAPMEGTMQNQSGMGTVVNVRLLTRNVLSNLR